MSCGNCTNCGCSDRPEFDAKLKVAHALADQVGKKLDEYGQALTPEYRAVQQFLAKPETGSFLCGCMGPQPLPGEEGKSWEEAKREPLCPCAMRWVEQVDGHFYKINWEVQGITKVYNATNIGPVGGPYAVNQY